MSIDLIARAAHFPISARAIVLGCLAAGIAVPSHASDDWNLKYATNRQVLTPVFGGLAVLDKETGLLWERTPSSGAYTWDDASSHCATLAVSSRLGWRLPTIQELGSILDLGQPNNLTPGNPYNALTVSGWNIGELIWSATSSDTTPGSAWSMNIASNFLVLGKGSLGRAWCVRFRQGVEAQ
jgi:hypothetical protein